MSRLLAFIVLCGICVVVFSSDEGTDCIFDWQSFSSVGDEGDILLDYSGQKITTLTEGGKTYNYIVGPVVTKTLVDDSYDVLTFMQKISDGKKDTILYDIRPACDFSDEIYAEYLLPIAGTHNDFKPHGSICPMEKGITQIFKAKNRMELLAPSMLENGNYYVYVTYLKDNKSVGGINGNFTVLRD